LRGVPYTTNRFLSAAFEDARVPRAREWAAGPRHDLTRAHLTIRRGHQLATGWTLILDPATGTSRWTSPHGAHAGNDTHRLDPQLYELSSHRNRPQTPPTTDPDAT
jgi:hypothetical protein